MSVYGREPQFDLGEQIRKQRMLHERQQAARNAHYEAHRETDGIVDLIDVNGVWMTPADAKERS